MNKQKILEQFHYFNIHAGVDSVYGNWAVSSEGDVVNSVFPYVITAIHLKDEDWLSIITEKFWFEKDSVLNLKLALDRANEIAK